MEADFNEDLAFDRVWHNARLATMSPDRPGLGVIENGAIASRYGRIAFVGPEAELPSDLLQDVALEDLEGRWVTPGLIDCHTHLVFAGNRAHDFERRLEGVSYEEIAREGGGILSSVAALREADETDLFNQTLPRLDALLAEGVTTLEIKSGYGLDLENERKSLRVARALPQHRSVGVHTTFLGAHALPPEAEGDKGGYIDRVVKEMLPEIVDEELVDAVDGFCESVAFSPEQIARVFSAARELGLPVKLHADQLSDLGGAKLAAEYGALSADHLEYASEAGIQTMASSGTVAVLLPGAFYFLQDTQKPPVEACRRHGVPIAVSTDANPGTSPLTSLLLTMNMAATLFGLTINECLLGVTRVAAQALGDAENLGTLETGKWTDLAIWDIERPAELVYRMGSIPLYQRIWRGV